MKFSSTLFAIAMLCITAPAIKVKQMAEEQYQQPSVDQQLDWIFDHIDTNNDGFISEPE